ncbi:MAG: LLM class flavin-dependent oxidoreductase [Cytophagales bacterium]|nr:LLM class flavin-dependent oxidoreductase [Cytophagales bacterium]
MIDYGVLELGFYKVFKTDPIEVIQETINRAEYFEQLGFKRVWVSEHYGAGCAWQAPEIILTLLAGTTKKIRIGVAGVMLTISIPLQVSHNYKLLNSLFYDRIDLGFSKGRPPEKNIYESLLDGRSEVTDFHKTITDLGRIIRNSGAKSTIPIPPLDGPPPKLWMLAMNPGNLEYAYKNHLNCCFSLCHRLLSKDEETTLSEAIRTWKSRFEEKNLKISILIAVICSEDQSNTTDIEENRIFDFLKLNFTGNILEYRGFERELLTKYRVDEIVLANIFEESSEFLDTVSCCMKSAQSVL